MTKLLAAFQQFFRENSEHWVERFDYKEAGSQLMLQAFLQRIIHSDGGGGRIEREYGLWRKRTDSLLIWNCPNSMSSVGGVQRGALELKVGSGASETLICEGLEQTIGYMDRCGADEGHLVIFDRNPNRTWEEKIWRRAEVHASRTIQESLAAMPEFKAMKEKMKEANAPADEVKPAKPACDPPRRQ